MKRKLDRNFYYNHSAAIYFYVRPEEIKIIRLLLFIKELRRFIQVKPFICESSKNHARANKNKYFIIKSPHMNPE
jgi:hypothetical protein